VPQTTIQQRRDMTEEQIAARLTEIRSEYAESANLRDTDQNAFNAARASLLAEVDDLDMYLSLHQMVGRGTRSAVGGAGGSIPEGALDSIRSQHEYRSPGQQVTDNEHFRAWCAQTRGGSVVAPSPTVELRTLVELSTDGGYLAPVGQPFLGNTRQMRLTVRDLLDVQTTGLGVVPYVREKNSETNALSASTVPEGGLKPEAVIEFTPDNANISVIAVTVPITTQILEDVPTLVGYINGRLGYLLKRREEQQLLSGAGTSADLKGLLSYTGDIQTQSTAGAGEYAQTIANAIAKIELVDGEADGVVMNPATAWNMYSHRAAAGSGNFDVLNWTQDIPMTVWGLPVVRSRALAANTNLVGSFRTGATLWDRQQAGVRVFEQHSDFAAYNKVLLRGEERIGLAVYRPDYFVVATTS
jgi:HK97 family phage major capsid protein